MSTTQITFYTHTLATGGGTRVIATLANLLAASGYPTRVVAVNQHEEPQRQWFTDGVDVQVFAATNRFQRIAELYRRLRTQEGVVFSCCEFASLLIPILRPRFQKRFRWAIVLHMAISQLRQMEKDNRLLQWGLRWARWSYSRADLVAAVSRGAAEELQDRLGLPQVDVLYNPVVDTDKQQSLPPPIPAAIQDVQHPVVLNVGRLHPVKDQLTLIEAFLCLEGGSLVILGDGPARAELETLVQRAGAASRVRIPGNVDNPIDYMYHSDLFVLSSRYEGLPTALIEAMSAGCPVVSTDCPSGPREILEGGRYGSLVPAGDVDAMASAMAAALQAPRQADRLRARANDFSYANSLASYVSVIQKLSS